MKHTSNHIVITPAKNEGATIGETIQSVINQSMKPREWIIVSDGSSDSTNAQVELASRDYPWIHLLPLTTSQNHHFGRIAHLISAGLRQISFRDYDWISLLDADILLPENYYEAVSHELNLNKSLGITGCMVTDVGNPVKIPRNLQDIPGAVQCIRRSCFEKIGGLLAIPEGGWDGIACAMARMNGYETQLLKELNAIHLKPRNISQGNLWKRKWQMGQRDYAAGYHPLFELLKCITRFGEAPIISGSIAWWFGYCTAWKKQQPRVIPQQVLEHYRKEQLQRIKCSFLR